MPHVTTYSVPSMMTADCPAASTHVPASEFTSPVPRPPSLSAHPTAMPSQHSVHSQAVVPTSEFTLPGPRFPSLSAHTTAIPSMYPVHSQTIVPQVKLPKLTMKKFNGDLTKWATFWDSFCSSIHSNPTLSSIDKFNYLSSLLDSTAAKAIVGLTPSDENYEEAVATLKRRFGNHQMIINRHIESLLNVTGVHSQHDIRGLRKLYNLVESHVRGLKALGVAAQTYG